MNRMDDMAVVATDTDTDVSLTEALEHADLRTLVMCLYQATGDEKWLNEPFAPARDVRLIAPEDAGFDDETGAEIRRAAREVFGSASPLAVPAPSGEQLVRLMSHCLGERVAPEYAPMIAADLGFAERQGARYDEPLRSTDVLVVGAGVSGICVAARLQRAGCDVHIIDRNADAGGNWEEATYPGSGVDTPNHFYSYSFAMNPDWSRYFSKRDEIRGYLHRVLEERGLRERTTFGYEVTAASWDEQAGRWTVTAHGQDGDSITRTCRVLVSASGHFSLPVTPKLPGMDEFRGEIVHTARWPESVDLTGKRVAVIGTGASAMQLVPTIAGDVAELAVYQRTPQWSRPIPEYNQPVDPRAKRLFTDIPNYGHWYRFAQFWRYGDGLLRFLKRDPEWPHPDRSLNRTNDRHRKEMTDFITSALDGRDDLIAKAVPSYPPFAKRILIDNGWFETLRQPHVELVTEPIETLGDAGITTGDGRLREFDVIVFATGYDVMNLAAAIDIRGEGGRNLHEEWAGQNPTAYLGMCVPGFPNFFMMFGPNTNMGHGGSVMWLAETQTDFIAEAVRRIDQHDIHALQPTEEARRQYTAKVDAEHATLVWSHPGMSTYYRNRSGVVRSPMPFRLVDYWTMTRGFDEGSFDIAYRTEKAPPAASA